MFEQKPRPGDGSPARRAPRAVLALLHPRFWVALARRLNHYSYDHVEPRARLDAGIGVRLSPTVSFRNAERISIGANTRIGDDCSLWAGSRSGRIVIGSECSFGPRVYVTASNYEMEAGVPVMHQSTVERDVVIGDGCWIGANVVIVAGVVIGPGCVVGAGAVVTKDLARDSIAVGVPARTVATRVGALS